MTAFVGQPSRLPGGWAVLYRLLSKSRATERPELRKVTQAGYHRVVFCIRHKLLKRALVPQEMVKRFLLPDAAAPFEAFVDLVS